MKSKIHSNKKVAAVLLGAGALAITGIAFGSWVISQEPKSDSISQISLQVGTVKDTTLAIEGLTFNNGNNTVRFDADSDDSTPPIVWESEDGATGGEDMTFAIQFDVTNAVSGSNTVANYDGLKLQMDVTDTEAGDFANAISKGYIVSPIQLSNSSGSYSGSVTLGAPGAIASNPTQEVSDGGISATYSDGGDGKLHVVIVFSFSWGTYFGETNPSHYPTPAEGKEYPESVSGVDDIKTALTELYKANSATFAITVTPIDTNYSGI